MRKNGIIFSFVRVSIAIIIVIGAFLSTKAVQADNDGRKWDRNDPCSGTKIHSGSGEDSAVSTLVSENNGTAAGMGGSPAAGGQTGLDIRRAIEGDLYGGTRWVSQSSLDRCDISQPTSTLAADPVELVGYGVNVRDRYESLKNTPGWWNADGDFTVQEFFGLWVLAEDCHIDLWGHMIAHAIAQNLYVGGWNDPDCQIGQVCQNGAFNFMGRYSQMQDSLLRETDGYRGPQGQHDSQTMTHANAFGKEAFSTTSLVWDRNGAAANWGNFKYLQDALLANGITPWNSGRLGSAKTTVNYTFQSFVVLSVNQYNYWDHERHIDMTLLSQ